MKKHEHESGFGIIEIILSVVVLALIGGLGWVAYDNFVAKKNPNVAQSHSNSEVKSSSSPNTTSDPYANWLQYCSKQEKSCFKYPPNWSAKDAGSVDPNGDGISLTSPSGTLLWFQSTVSGLGGTCDPKTGTNVFIKKVIAEPQVPNLYIVEVSYGNTPDINHIGLVNGTAGAPKIGDTGSCMYYTTFQSKHDPSASAWFEINGYSSAYLKSADIPTVELILESYSY